ncbi:nucleotidyltransferase family protein [Pricia sp. S334]|uniref:Nucleotidyltransferase family protein n=1 Tax=Pricia mediterranea TaxID=3076079 RepID=A0ABU3LAK2_9FLAO|nr:nucleotidyltransferase family protein [Pricia sp. S334]MDT7830413.1 nucleotidyltransferase family protein [Pricia sp. S334]
MNSPKNIAVLILAAGASSRMGLVKQLLPWKDTTLLGQTIQTATASDAASVTVVLGANAASIRNGIAKFEVGIVENSDWSAGLGSSIARGTDYLTDKDNKPDGILMMLADQPLIDTVYLNTMMVAFERGQRPIVATRYENRAGVPALFSASLFEELMALENDSGAKDIIEEHDVLVLDSEGITVDIDTKSDYEKLNH